MLYDYWNEYGTWSVVKIAKETGAAVYFRRNGVMDERAASAGDTESCPLSHHRNHTEVKGLWVHSAWLPESPTHPSLLEQTGLFIALSSQRHCRIFFCLWRPLDVWPVLKVGNTLFLRLGNVSRENIKWPKSSWCSKLLNALEKDKNFRSWQFHK